MTPDKTELMTITMIDAMINLMIGRHMATVWRYKFIPIKIYKQFIEIFWLVTCVDAIVI